ncbi:hypothetical protein Tco_0408628 [Tanacetum coccineum]
MFDNVTTFAKMTDNSGPMEFETRARVYLGARGPNEEKVIAALVISIRSNNLRRVWFSCPTSDSLLVLSCYILLITKVLLFQLTYSYTRGWETFQSSHLPRGDSVSPELLSRVLRLFRRWRSAPLSTPYPPTTSESSLGSSSEGSLDSSSPSFRPSRKRCRSPTASVPSPTHVSRSIAPTPVDLLPPSKRFRDSILKLEDRERRYGGGICCCRGNGYSKKDKKQSKPWRHGNGTAKEREKSKSKTCAS